MEIRIISRPIAPPWDSGSMNMAYGLGVCLGERSHRVCLPVVRGFHPSASNVIPEPVYTSRVFGLRQKMRLVGHLLTAQSADIAHFFLGPTRTTATILPAISALRHTASVLTVTHVPRPGRRPVAFGQRVVAYSAHTARLLQRWGIERVVHIPPGIDERAIRPRIGASGTRNTLGVPPEAPLVLYAGEYGPSATIETLLSAISLCIARHPQIHFVLACRIRRPSEQVRKRELARQLQTVPWGKNVILLEQVQDMLGLVARADVCILPLRDTYGKVDLPLFLLEAMAMAKPIVITDIAPLNELLSDEAVGVAVPVDDDQALAQAIERMLVDGKSYGVRGRQLVERKYALRKIARRYENLYLELLGARHSNLLR